MTAGRSGPSRRQLRRLKGLAIAPQRSGSDVAYFRNTTVNLLNLHYGIHSLALTGSGSFFVVFLLKSGVPAPAVLAAFAAILAGRFVIRPSVIVLARRTGLKPLVIAGTLASGVQYPLLAEVQGIGAALLALCVVSAVGDTLYWTTYHAYFAALGDAEHRGHQVGAREAVAAVVGIVGPLATGWALTTLGPRIAFDASAIVMVLAALPILWTPNVAVRSDVSGAFRAAIPGAVSGLFLGRLIDTGHGTRAAWVALAALVITTILRAVSYGNAPLAVIANACGALVVCLYVPAFGTAVYNQAKRSPCTLRFHVATEGGWDAGGAAGLLIAATATEFGLPLGGSILLSIAGLAAIAILLRRYYAESDRVDPGPVSSASAAPAARPIPAAIQPR